MSEFKLWSVEGSGQNIWARPMESVRSKETERTLEGLRVSSRDLLMASPRLSGRQLPTDPGSVDLLGADPTGRLVVSLFELRSLATQDGLLFQPSREDRGRKARLLRMRDAPSQSEEAGGLMLVLTPRAANATGEAIDALCSQALRAIKQKDGHSALEPISAKPDWDSLS